MKYLHLGCILFGLGLAACNSDNGGRGPGVGSGSKDLSPTTGQDGGTQPPPDPDYDGGIVVPDDGGYVVQDPATCDEAAANKSYIGCDYWPTVTFNGVVNSFDFAVVVSNPGTAAATVTVTGPNATNQTVTVMPGQLSQINLAWVKDLKGPDSDDSSVIFPTESVFVEQSAYHLVSSVPVLVYQFNALEYKKGSEYSYSNDASLLLPSTAMTGNYRVATERGLDIVDGTDVYPISPSFVAVTATADNTTFKIQLGAKANVVKGTAATGKKEVRAVAAGGTDQYTLNAGDVIEFLTDVGSAFDLSGSLLQADKPIQVIGGSPCVSNPETLDPRTVDPIFGGGSPYSCDHVEEIVLPAETLGKHYLVTVPTGPTGKPVAHTVRFVGNVDGTKLTYSSTVTGAPSTLNAGQVVELSNVTKDFEVTGDHEFIVNSVQKSGGIVDPQLLVPEKGDPSLSAAVAVEQYRLSYVFLAPTDYDVSYADVTGPVGAKLILDGQSVTTAATTIGGGFGVFRIKLGAGSAGAHTLTSDQPVGLQVSGYGAYTSYQYPGGLNLLSIAPPPPPIS